MTGGKKAWLITAVILIIMGTIIFTGAMSVKKWDFTKLSTSKFETKKYEITEGFRDISIVTSTNDIRFLPSDDSSCTVECYEQEKVTHSVTVKDGVLVIEVVDSRKWYDYIGITFATPSVTVRIPRGEYGSLTIRNSTGDVNLSTSEHSFAKIDVSQSTGDVICHAYAESVKIETSTGDIKCYSDVTGEVDITASTGNVSMSDASIGSLAVTVTTGKVSISNVVCAGDVRIDVTTGKALLSNMSCNGLTSNGSTGDITLDSLIASERISIERSTGDVKFNASDAAEIYVKTDTGKVSGTLLSEKIFITRTDTGDIDVPKSVTGGRCEITTDTGDIRITIAQ